MNPSRMRMDSCICATAVRKPLVMKEFRLVNTWTLFMAVCYCALHATPCCEMMYITQHGHWCCIICLSLFCRLFKHQKCLVCGYNLWFHQPALTFHMQSIFFGQLVSVLYNSMSENRLYCRLVDEDVLFIYISVSS